MFVTTVSDRPRPPRDDRGGFVLAFVVLMLFTISVAGATGYLVVSTEFAMSRHGTEGAEALAVARAGLERYAAEQLGVLGDSVSYAIGDGTAVVTRIKVMSKDSLTDLYYLRSEGTVTDILSPSTPAKRVVGGYAWHHRRPLRQFGALMISETTIDVKDWLARDEVVGVDSSTVADCSGGGAAPIAGVIALNNAMGSGNWTGSPDDEFWGSYAAMYDSVALRWDVLTDASFPVDYHMAWPNFATLPADSFPVIRLVGNWYFSDAWDGRGVLIVTGQYDAASDFDWSGIILAGSVESHVHGQVRGMFVGGLNGANPGAGDKVIWHATADYYSCYGYEANESLSYLELMENTVFESN
jgi:hypothetical protein